MLAVLAWATERERRLRKEREALGVPAPLNSVKNAFIAIGIGIALVAAVVFGFNVAVGR